VNAAVLAVAVGGGLACPAHMWWQRRRGKRAACCPPSRSSTPGDSAVPTGVEALRERQRVLAEQLRVVEADRNEGSEVIS